MPLFIARLTVTNDKTMGTCTATLTTAILSALAALTKGFRYGLNKFIFGGWLEKQTNF
jgi:hypothetical protein